MNGIGGGRPPRHSTFPETRAAERPMSRSRQTETDGERRGRDRNWRRGRQWPRASVSKQARLRVIVVPYRDAAVGVLGWRVHWVFVYILATMRSSSCWRGHSV